MVDILGKDVELEILKLPREEQILGKSIADPIESSQTLVFGDVAARTIPVSGKVTRIFGQLWYSWYMISLMEVSWDANMQYECLTLLQGQRSSYLDSYKTSEVCNQKDYIQSTLENYSAAMMWFIEIRE